MEEIICLQAKNSLLYCFSQRISHLFWLACETWWFGFHSHSTDTQSWAVRSRFSSTTLVRVLLPHTASFKSLCWVVIPDVLRQHLCLHFQFYRLQRPIWRLSEAIVSLVYADLSALCISCFHLVASRHTSHFYWNVLFYQNVYGLALYLFCFIYSICTRQCSKSW